MQDVRNWLAELGLERFASAFAEAEVQFDDLPNLTDSDLKEIGLPVGPRRRASSAIKAMTGTEAEVTASLRLSKRPQSENQPAISSDAERRHLTVMFVDLVGSTEMATRLDAEDMRKIITEYQKQVSEVVRRSQGFVAKFMGDGVLCYFGWPRANEDDAERAVRAALSIVDCVSKTNAPDGTALATRIGIATGVVVVGDLIGSGAAQEAAVVGETPNLAARLQGVAKSDEIVLPNETRRLLGSRYKLRSIGDQDLKGLGQAVEAFVVEGEAPVESRFAAHHTGTLIPVVGRDREIKLMRESWALARLGQGQMVVVSGEAGIGKSRITRALIDGIDRDTHTRITYQCSPYHTDSAFFPVIQQLSLAAGFTSADGPDSRLQKLETFLGGDQDTLKLIAPMMGLDATRRCGDLDLTSGEQRAQTMQTLVRLLTRQARDQPVLLVYEDLHWIDPTSLELLELVLAAIVDLNVMILATARPTFESGFGGHPAVTRLALNRLGKDQIGSLVTELSGGKSLPGEIVELISQRTDGVPLFVEELTKTILESGALKEDGDRLVLDGALHAIAIPSTLHDSLMARLDRLQPIKNVAQTAACIGREFSHELLAQILTISATELGTALHGLIAAELISRRGLPPESTYLFKHALVRDAAYESLLREQRQAVHARIFSALEAVEGVAPAVLALHAECAGRDDGASTYWRQAGLASVGSSASNEALRQFERAIQALRRLPESKERALAELSIRTDMTGPLVSVEGYSSEKMQENVQNALKLSEETGEVVGIFPTLYGRFVFHLVTAQLPVAVDLADEILGLASGQDHPEPIMLGHRVVGLSNLFSGELSKAVKHLQAAVNFDIQESHRSAPYLYGQDIETASRCLYSLALSHTGRPDEALRMANASFGRAQKLNHPHSLAYALAFSSFGFSDWQRVDELNWCLRRLKAVISENPDMHLWPLMEDYLQFRCLALSARPEKALPHVDSFLTGMTAARFTVMLPGVIAEKADALVELGDGDAAMQSIDDALEMARSSGEFWQISKILGVKARVHLLLGDDLEANNTFQLSLHDARQYRYAHSELRVTTQYASFLRHSGKREHAKELLDRVLGKCTEGANLPDMVAAYTLRDALAV